MMRNRLWRLLWLGLILLGEGAYADPVTPACARRLGIAFTGAPSAQSTGGSASELTASFLASAEFFERFARFINSRFNPIPGQTPADDTAYHFVRYVLEQGLPWEQLFLGKLNLMNVRVVPDEGGLGYFRTNAWQVRYAGNEEAGVRIVSAYRMLQNTVGLKLAPAQIAAGVDSSATGREAAGCRGCHYDGWYALDPMAVVLGRVTRNGAGDPSFPPYQGPAVELLGQSMSSDAELVAALVHSQRFQVNTCRLAFEFLFGRTENSCEGPVFDRCVTAFGQSGRIQDALAAIATDDLFCAGTAK
jgi:hypothetical protein